MYHIRAETQGGKHKDTQAPGRTLADAKTAFETANPALAPFDWRGQVVFCQGTRPAEETTGPGRVVIRGDTRLFDPITRNTQAFGSR